jgi:type IV pilus assembly protein PilC
VQALRAIVDQNENKAFRDMIYDIASSVEAGLPFSAALSRHPNSFSLFYINLIKSGEASGDLEGMLVYLADHLEKDSELQSKVKGAFIYPSVILFVFSIVGVVFMVYIVPKITAMFEGTGKELPLITKVIIAISDALINYSLILLLIGIGLGWIIRYWIKYEKGNETIDEIKIRLPVFGGLFKKMYITQFAENLSTLLSGGIAMIDALKISANVIENTPYQRLIMAAAEKVKTGETISSVFHENSNLMPPMVVTMIKIGEKTGKLDTVLKKIAYFYGRDVDGVVSNISSLIEPVIILTLGGAAAVLVAAILLPIYDIAGV